MSNNSQTENERPSAVNALKEHVLEKKVDVTLWATRFLVLFFTFFYFIPIFGNPANSYYKVLIANAAISALRLHQRLPPFALSRDYFRHLVSEDSFHYLWFSIIFLYVSPITLAILPVFLFCLIHFASYSLTILDTLGQNSWWGARLSISLVEFQTRNILRLIAFAEIFLMPFVVIMIFLGKAGLFTPFMYYHFLTMRYSSRRNPYTKNMFTEIRQVAERIANNSKTPGFVKTAIGTGIQLVIRLAPPTEVPHQE